MLSLIEHIFASNQDLVSPWCPDFDVLGGIGIANKNFFSSLVDIELGTLFIRYKNICSAARVLKVKNVLPILCPYTFSEIILHLECCIKSLFQK